MKQPPNYAIHRLLTLECHHNKLVKTFRNIQFELCKPLQLYKFNVEKHGKFTGLCFRTCTSAAFLFEENQVSKAEPVYDYTSYLKKSVSKNSLAEGKLIHAHMIITGFISGSLIQSPLVNGTFIQNHLVNMYSKCGSITDARHVFDEMPRRNVFSCNTMISGYAKFGNIEDAVQLFTKMLERDLVSWNAVIAACAQFGRREEALKLYCKLKQQARLKPDHFTFTSILSVCANLTSVQCGRQVHADLIKMRFTSNVFLEPSIVEMYVKHEKMEDARQVFDRICEPNVFAWNTMIVGYSKCSRLEHARALFEKMPERNVVSWNAIIGSYAQHDRGMESLKLFLELHRSCTKPDHATFACALNACASLQSLEQGKHLHGHIVKTGLELNVFVGTALVDMYAKCESLGEALQLFEIMPKRNVVSWTAMSVGYALLGNGEAGLTLFSRMQREGIKPDQFTYASVLGMCGSVMNVRYGTQVHTHMIKRGFESDVPVGNALVTMYAKCGRIHDANLMFDKMVVRNIISWTSIITGNAMFGTIECAQKLFDKMPARDVLSWNAMVAAYTQVGHGEKAIELYIQMQWAETMPDWFTFVNVLSACTTLAALQQGRQVHVHIIRNGLESDVPVGNDLIRMYSKCGSIEDALHVFNDMLEKDDVSWNAMIAGCAQHGLYQDVFQLFERMVELQIKLDRITFVSIISACNHAGLVDKGCYYFDSMRKDHCIAPRAEHYACMIDLFGRAGCLAEAEDFINNMPIEPNVSVWGALLGACRIHGNIELAKRAAEAIFELEPQDSETYVILVNIYASAGMWDEAAKVRNLMKEKGVNNYPGCTWIEVNNRVHAFMVDD